MIRLYNTMAKEKVDFVPKEEGKAGMYVCGVTPYNYCHLGHARAYITFDMIKRYLKFAGYKVYHVQNFTDVDDKLIKQAIAENSDIFAIGQKYIQAYYEDMDRLGVEKADIYPLVTSHMPEIVELVQGLLDNGHAYEVAGDVYFSVESFSDYGKLSGRSLEDMKAGARVDVDERKKHPMDFALWKAAKTGEPSWDSPWGKGRPGWHIECSALSLKYLGNSFDIHGGGADLVFPHHENEIAQTEAYTGKAPFVRYWLHNGFVMINEEKMSKSLNNFATIRDILKIYPAAVLRYFLLSTHYRSPIDFSDEKLTEAKKALERLTNSRDNLLSLLKNAQEAAAGDGSPAASKLSDASEKCISAFREAMDDDFNTALAIGVLFDYIREVNTFIGSVSSGMNAAEYAAAVSAAKVLEGLDSVLGIFSTGVQKTSGDSQLTEKLILLMIDIRNDARKEKNFALSDRLRDGLKSIGVSLEDSPQGTRYRITDNE